MSDTLNPAGSPIVRDTTPGAKQSGRQRSGSDEFDRFKDLTRKITQVPKTEVDAKRKA